VSIRNLQYLFKPKSVAVIGASNRDKSVGREVMRNLLRTDFHGPIMPVNPKYSSVAGVLSHPDVNSLPTVPDLAVICTPAPTVPGLITELGERGTRAAIVISDGLTQTTTEDGHTLQQAMLEAARPNLLRILGPNCLGLLVPGDQLNASFAHRPALPGSVALIHQSGALCTALLDWATTNGIGFSHFISVGDSADVDFGDVLDYLGGDPAARAILMYVESIQHARKFMSAARAAARNKPVVMIKAGRAVEGARAAASHTGALMGSDDVYDAAIRRAGMLRVFTTREMFDAVETLTSTQKLRGDRLAILTNGGGPGVIATDELVLSGGALAELSPETIEQLAAILPSTWSRANPIDIIGDADSARYSKSLEIVLGDDNVDCVLVLHAPTAVVSSDATAEGVVRIARQKRNAKTLLACWLGGATVTKARRMLTDAGIPNYDTPDEAITAFLHISQFNRNQALLMEMPASIPEAFEPVMDPARLVIETALASGHDILSEPEAKAVLSAYGIPVVKTRIAGSPEEAARVASQLGYPVAIKILAEEITHKSDVGGVVLDLGSRDEVHAAAAAMAERVQELRPDVKRIGFTVQNMARRPGAYELIVGAATDSTFGPVILFGEGGTAVEVIADKAVALPPLNMKLAGELIDSTRVARRLDGYRDRPPVNRQEIQLTLIRIAQLVADIPEIAEIDINPLIADDQGVLALDARIRIQRTDVRGAERLAIRPYPKELEETVQLDGMDLMLRPIRPEDEPNHKKFLNQIDPSDIRFRFFGSIRKFVHSQLARLTQIDYDREMAFIAVESPHDNPYTIGVVRIVCNPDNTEAEFAIIVHSGIKRRGLGRVLMNKVIDYSTSRGTHWLVGQVLANNRSMLNLARSLGFRSENSSDEGVVHVRLDLQKNRAQEKM
jgi:acetyltransferase